MVYLDYSATTPVNEEVLDSFNKVCKNYIGNPNSLHRLGFESSKIIEASINQVQELLNTNGEIIYTSGASEANNLAIKGICLKYHNRGKKIITTPLEHSSVYGPLNYLKQNGFIIEYVKLDKNGKIDLLDLEKKLDHNTLLVTISAVNSEIGIIQDIEKIGEIVKKNNTFFHTDLTQMIGKIKLSNTFFDNIDFATISSHKIYGINGIGCLIKKKNIDIEPIIHGGKSISIYRSGTPNTALIVSFSKALRLALTDLESKYLYISNLNKKIKEHLKKYDKVYINSNEECLPHILNISIINIKPETFLHALEEDEIYISTKSACSTSNISEAVFSLTNDEMRAKTSLRISLSYLTTEEEIQIFLNSFDKWYQKLGVDL